MRYQKAKVGSENERIEIIKESDLVSIYKSSAENNQDIAYIEEVDCSIQIRIGGEFAGRALFLDEVNGIQWRLFRDEHNILVLIPTRSTHAVRD